MCSAQDLWELRVWSGNLAVSSSSRHSTVYAMSRWQLLAANLRYPLLVLGGLLFGLPLLIYGLQDLLAGHVGGLLFVFFGAGWLSYVVWSGRVTVQSFRLERRQAPYFLIDDQGVECARGRFVWEDVIRVVEVIDRGSDSSSRSLIFVLQDGMTPQPVERAYLDGFDKEAIGAASLTDYGLELTINHCKKQAREALASYGYRPLRVERKELEPNQPVARY